MTFECIHAVLSRIVQKHLVERASLHLIAEVVRCGESVFEVHGPQISLDSPNPAHAKLLNETCLLHLVQDAELFEQVGGAGE